jgi:hypothetical protein
MIVDPLNAEEDDKPCGIIFEFAKLEQAKAFAVAIKQRFGLDVRVFDDAEAAYRSHHYPFVQNPPVAHVNRVWPETDAELTAVKRRFGLKAREIAAWRKEFLAFPGGDEQWAQQSAIQCAAEDKVSQLALEFGGEWIGT